MLTRSEALFDLTRRALRATGTTERAFACAVADRYRATVPLHLRTIEFRHGDTLDAAEEAQRANAQLLRRMSTGEVRLPADLEEAWAAALPGPWAHEAQAMLARRHGMLGARAPAKPSDPPEEQAATLACYLHAAAEDVVALAPIFADGRVDESDAVHAERALKALADTMAAVQSLMAQIRQATGPAPKLRSLRSAAGEGA